MIVFFSISTEERLERLRESISGLDLESSDVYEREVYSKDNTNGISAELGAQEMLNGTSETVQLSSHCSITETPIIMDPAKQESVAAEPISNFCDSPVYDIAVNNQPTQRNIPNAVLPLLRYQQYDSSESSSRYSFIYRYYDT